MISSLRGRLIRKQAPRLYIDVAGIGYEVEAPMTTFYRLSGQPGDEIHIYTHLVVREDAHILFGFATEEERSMFRSLIKVNGVGARMALTILSGIEADEFAACVREGDAGRLVRLPGVGKKTAERLIVEMRDRLKDWQKGSPGADVPVAEGGRRSGPAADAISALISLGYKPQEASRYVHAVAREGMDSETIIRESLKASVK